MEVYLIRHGRTAGDPHAHFEPPVKGCLSDLGVEQAEALAAALNDTRFDAIYASPLGRTIQTAQPLARTQGLEITVLPWIEEWRPAHIMDGGDDANYETMMAASAELHPEKSWKTDAGEGTFEMAHRIIPGWIKLMEEHGIHAGHGGYLFDNPDDASRIALFAHGGSLGLLTAFILGIPLQPFSPISFMETGLAVITFIRRSDVWYPQLRVEPPYRPSIA
ncbi:MAG: phosphoglycerate mutase family protein [Verrucomicrobia bacterium]|nr:phosphoglycerate mutase family protein [Verrucomicrobiota bacterium]